jgi:hypothetical protein
LPVVSRTPPRSALPQGSSFGGNHTANYRGCAKWKEAKAALTKRTPAPRVHMNGATGRSASAQATRAEPSAEQKSLGPEWSHVVRGVQVVNPTTPSQPQPTLKPAAAPKQGKAPASRKEVKATQPAVAAPTKKQAMTGKPCLHLRSLILLPFHLPISLQLRRSLICSTTFL